MEIYGILAGIAAASIWGGMYVVSKVVLDIIPPFTLLSLRLVLGAVCLLVVIAIQGRWSASRKLVIRALLVGFIGYGISLGLQFTGTKLSTAANAALVTSASPVFILLFGAWILKERVTATRVLALMLASIGVMAVVDPRAVLLGGEEALGNLILLGAALTWGLYSVLIKILTQGGSILEISLYAFMGGLPLSMTAAGLEWHLIQWQSINGAVILGILYLGVISTALAMYLWNSALARLEAGIVSLLFFAQPVVGASLGAIFLGETLELGFWIGAALISTGLILAAREQFIHSRGAGSIAG
ncbi:MAG: DMT family transporter [Anaerolineales bacterium]|nr:MAG: DMT family transporter [Anaerolineales bacterium]